MGTDIYSGAERRENGRWVAVDGVNAFDRDRKCYRTFAFLAGVRNYSEIVPIAEPRGAPGGTTKALRRLLHGCHSRSWLSVEELLAYDYDQIIEDRRVARELSPGHWNDAQTCEIGQGRKMPLREFLGEDFFEDLQELKAAGAERIVFGFDS